MAWVQPKFTPAGQVIVSPMVGPWEQYPKGSPKWAEALAAHLQGACRRTQDKTDPGRITMVLKEALFSDPPPWNVWPEEAKGNPDAWVRMVTLTSWAEVSSIITMQAGADAWEPIAQALQRHGVEGVSAPQALATVLHKRLTAEQLAELGRILTGTSHQPPASARDRKRKQRGTDLSPRPCACCGATFTPKRTDARFCSGRCRARASRARASG